MFEKYLLGPHMGEIHHEPPKGICCFPSGLQVRKMLFSYLETCPCAAEAVGDFPRAALRRAHLHCLSSSCLCRITFSFNIF